MGATTKNVSTTPREIQPLRGSIVDAFMSGNVGPNMGNNPYNQSYMNARKLQSPASMPNPFSWGPMTLSSNDSRGWQGMMNKLNEQDNPGYSASPEFLDMLNENLFRRGGSLDSYADPEGALFGDLQGRFNDLFGQNREMALAQAKEASGNLTGSGYAASMGNVVNRSLAEQNSTVGNLLAQLAMMQYQQEGSMAQNESQRFLQFLMGMAGGGVAPDQVVSSGGPGAVLGPLGAGIGFGLGGPIGSWMGGQLGGAAGGGN